MIKMTLYTTLRKRLVKYIVDESLIISNKNNSLTNRPICLEYSRLICFFFFFRLNKYLFINGNLL